MKKVQNKGFTLIELIFVLVILAILIGILVATYPGLTHHMKVNTDRASAKNIANAVRSWYVDHNTDAVLKPKLEEFLNRPETPNIKKKTMKLVDVVDLTTYMDVYGNKPVSLLNANKVTEPIQNFFVGVVDDGLDIRIVVSVGVDEGIDITSITSDTLSSDVATYDGYSPGIIYIEN